MDCLLIHKSQIAPLLKAGMQQFTVYAPLREDNRDCCFRRLSPDNQEALSRLCLQYDNLVVPPKNIFFPQLEKMFDFVSGQGREPADILSPRLIFGARACDWKGMLFSDAFFRRNICDQYYLQRVKNRLVVISGCLSPPRKDKCFCASAKTGPFLDEGFDLQLVDIGGDYLVEVDSSAGRRFVQRYRSFFAPAEKKQLRQAAEVKHSARRSLGCKLDFFRALKKMQRPGEEFKRLYEQIGQRCIYCAGCLYVCPTCTCFNVFDYKHSRMRNWDACIFKGYMQEAGGHNPRREKWQRAARRYEHKLRYDYQLSGVSGCVGCGRCLDSCPVNIGMSEFIRQITD